MCGDGFSRRRLPNPHSTKASAIATLDLDVALTPDRLNGGLSDRAVLVVDVFRAGTAVITALANGARSVIPVGSQGEAGRLAARFDADVSLFAGERDGVALPGYATGSSPSAFGAEAVSGKTVVLLTSNGTPSLARAKGTRQTAVGAFVNAVAAADFLRGATRDGRGATVVCAGYRGGVALEDALCAGLLVDRVAGSAAGLGDGAQIAYGLYQGARDNLARALFAADRTQKLIQAGQGDDVAACAHLDALDVLPVLRDNQFVAS